MDLAPMRLWRPPADWANVTTLDLHTEGEPLRIITSGLPEIPGDTILAKRRWARENLDHLRTALMWEPRGHADMYGCIVTPPVTPEADFGVLFLHNEGFSTMCGHGIIAVTTAAVETGLLASGAAGGMRDAGWRDAQKSAPLAPEAGRDNRPPRGAGREADWGGISQPSTMPRPRPSETQKTGETEPPPPAGAGTSPGGGVIAASGARETRVGIDTPAGFVEAWAQYEDGRVQSVRFRNVPSFLAQRDAVVDVPGLGPVRYDLAFGGAFYAYVDAADIDLSLTPETSGEIIAAGRAIKRAVMDAGPIVHSEDPDLGFLYGVIFVGPPEDPAHHSRNVCVFAEGELDRSPTGTGVSGRVAIHHARGELGVGEPAIIESILGTPFTARVLETTTFGGYDAVIPEVQGRAWITGQSTFTLDPTDPLAHGFILR